MIIDFKKFTIITYLLLLVLAFNVIRFGISVIIYHNLRHLISVGFYLIPIVGIALKQKWGSIFSAIWALIVIFGSILSIKLSGFHLGLLVFSLSYGLILFILSIKEYKQISA